MNVNIDKKVFNEVYLPFLDCDDRYLIFYGGGSSRQVLFHSTEIYIHDA